MILRILSLCVGLAIGTSAAAQTNIDLGGVNADPSAPVEITADRLSVDQDTGTALFQGNVVVGQSDLRLSAAEVQVVYDGTSGDITRLSASGGVTFVTATDAAEANAAEYDLANETLVMRGDVLLTQGASAIAADTMRIDLATGAAQMDGRVRTVFTQGNN